MLCEIIDNLFPVSINVHFFSSETYKSQSNHQNYYKYDGAIQHLNY